MSGIFAGIGKLEAAPGYSLADDFPVWQDITTFMRAEESPLLGGRGRQSELDTIEPGTLGCVLDNTDLRFTPGYTDGPYGANWTAGCPIRYSETIGSRTFTHFVGALNFPDTDDWEPIGYQEVHLSAIDRLGTLARGQPFISTLAAHIIYNGRSSGLLHYWPLGEIAGPNLRSIGGAVLTEQDLAYVPFVAVPTPANNPLVVYGGATPIEGDELAGLLYNPAIGGGSVGAIRTASHFGTIPAVNVGSGQTLALVGWVNWTRTTVDGPLMMQLNNPISGPYVQVTLDSADGAYYLSARDDTSAQTDLDSVVPGNIGAWRLVAIRVSEPSGLVEFWHHGDPPLTFTLSGAPSTMTGMTGIRIGNNAPAQMEHLQIYGGVGAYPRSAHLAQVAQGYLGLDKQSSGARINTILDYAGVPLSARLVDAGVSPMSRATLAGTSPATALSVAVDTERGRGFVDGVGRYVFHDRPHVYNT